MAVRSCCLESGICTGSVKHLNEYRRNSVGIPLLKGFMVISSKAPEWLKTTPINTFPIYTNRDTAGLAMLQVTRCTVPANYTRANAAQVA